MYANEAAAIQQYWFDVDDRIFPKSFPEPNVGIVWGNGAAYNIWWDGSVDEIHAINFLPVTGASLYLGQTPDYLKLNQAFLTSNPGYKGNRLDTHLKVKAFYDASSAITEFNQHPNFEVEKGESKAHVYFWIHNMRALGKLAINLKANVPTAAAFVKEEQITYVAFNPSSVVRDVVFSNGATLTVQPRSYAVKKESKTLARLFEEEAGGFPLKGEHVLAEHP